MICVNSVEASSNWNQTLLGLVSDHGGNEYERLMFEDQLILQLHAWDAHDHPNLGEPEIQPVGHGVALWFATDDFDSMLARAHPETGYCGPLRHAIFHRPHGVI